MLPNCMMAGNNYVKDKVNLIKSIEAVSIKVTICPKTLTKAMKMPVIL